MAAASTVPGWRRCGRGVFWSRRAAVWPRRLLVHGGGGVAAPSSGTWGRRCSHAVLGYMGRRCGPWFTNHPSFVNHVCKSRAMVYKPRAPSPETCPWLTPTQDVKMSRCPDLSVDILWPVRCQDVKMSRLVGGHLIDRKMSRCQDVKMSILVGGHLMAREMSRCQDVHIAGGKSYGP